MRLSLKQYKLVYFAMSATLLISCLFFAQAEPETYISRDVIWKEVQKVAPRYDLDPLFVYSIIFAESSFNTRAETHVAKGLMQLTEIAWMSVSDRSYREAFDWKANIEVGCAYLKWCKDDLVRRGRFSYPMLAAAYHYGPSRVRNQNFNLAGFGQHANLTYRRIFGGDYQPVQPPGLVR